MIEFSWLKAGALITAALWSAPEQALASEELDVLSYRIEATLGAEELTETVTLIASSKSAPRSLALELSGQMELLSCRLDDEDVPFERSAGELILDLAAAGAPRGEFAIVFELRGSPRNQQSNGYVRTVISPEHCRIRSQYAWYPRVAGDPALFHTSLTVREDWLARTAGKLVSAERAGESRTWIYKLEKPALDIGLVAGEYVRVEGEQLDGIELDALVFEEHEQGAEVHLATAARAIAYFTELFGPMSEDRFTLVEMPADFGAGSGYGETGYALIGSGAFKDAEGATWAESLVAHEISHTWWGREVNFSDFANEMLATYSTLRYLEEFKGLEAAREERRKLVQRVVSVEREKGLVPLEEIRGWGSGLDSAIYSACAYNKAAMLLHVLEQTAGRKALDAALRKLFGANRDRMIGYGEVKQALGKSRFRWLFDQWGTDSLPVLEVEQTIAKSGSSHTVRGTLSQSGTEEPFRMNVTLRAISGEQSMDHVVKLVKSEASFKFSCPFEPESILIDPDCHLICSQPELENLETLTQEIFKVANSPKSGEPATLRRTIEKIRKVIASGPENGSVYHTALGRCLFRLGEVDEAREEFETALAGGAGGPFHRAWLHLRLGNIADLEEQRSLALEHYEKVLASSDVPSHRFQKELAERFAKRPYRGYASDG